LEGEYRIDSLVLAFEQAIRQKGMRDECQALTEEERTVLAVEELEREVNDGGFDQFFTNSSKLFAPTIVDALQRIGCKKIATIAQQAIKALGISDLTAEAIDTAMAIDDELRLAKLGRCDDSYYKCAEPIAERLFAFIKANKVGITF
jgi:ATP/maltotriose-dependent transcriptional regulator MalT